jgi:hypothetical protein
MWISVARSMLILSLAVVAGACANDKSEPEQELAQMRMEIEQLTNALGRLEFRVYELENQQGAGQSGDDKAADAMDQNAPATKPAPNTDSAPEKNDKRFDLAPVE